LIALFCPASVAGEGGGGLTWSRMSMKYLLWLGVIAVVWWVWSKRQAAGSARPARKTPPDAPPKAAPEAEQMVRCAHCGVYLPASDSLAKDGDFYCCAAHQAAGPAAGSR
jgi:uncharacterized protein